MFTHIKQKGEVINGVHCRLTALIEHLRPALHGRADSRDRADLHDTFNARLIGCGGQERENALHCRADDSLRRASVGRVEGRGDVHNGVDADDSGIVGSRLRLVAVGMGRGEGEAEWEAAT